MTGPSFLKSYTLDVNVRGLFQKAADVKGRGFFKPTPRYPYKGTPCPMPYTLLQLDFDFPEAPNLKAGQRRGNSWEETIETKYLKSLGCSGVNNPSYTYLGHC